MENPENLWNESSWFVPKPKKKNHHLCELKIIKLVEHGEFDLFFIRDYFEKLLLPLDHGIGKLQEPLGN